MAQTELTRRRYDRLAWVYGHLPESRRMAAWRRQLWARAQGDILEVGVGTGLNMPFYPPGSRVTAIDFSPRMLARARRQAERLGIAADLRLMDVQHLDFPDHAFDCIVTTYVFCSVPDPVQGLRELRRVCRPGGRILMLEHMRSARPGLARLMDWLNPVVVRLTGANINRDTLGNLQVAGLMPVRVDHLMLDIMRYLEVVPNPASRE